MFCSFGTWPDRLLFVFISCSIPHYSHKVLTSWYNQHKLRWKVHTHLLSHAYFTLHVLLKLDFIERTRYPVTNTFLKFSLVTVS